MTLPLRNTTPGGRWQREKNVTAVAKYIFQQVMVTGVLIAENDRSDKKVLKRQLCSNNNVLK